MRSFLSAVISVCLCLMACSCGQAIPVEESAGSAPAPEESEQEENTPAHDDSSSEPASQPEIAESGEDKQESSAGAAQHDQAPASSLVDPERNPEMDDTNPNSLRGPGDYSGLDDYNRTLRMAIDLDEFIQDMLPLSAYGGTERAQRQASGGHVVYLVIWVADEAAVSEALAAYPYEKPEIVLQSTTCSLQDMEELIQQVSALPISDNSQMLNCTIIDIENRLDISVWGARPEDLAEMQALKKSGMEEYVTMDIDPVSHSNF